MFADVTSANVVGYQKAAVPESGYNFYTRTFKTVDGSAFYLSDLKPGANILDSTLSFLDSTTGGQRAFKPNEDGAMIECDPSEVDEGIAVYGDFKYLSQESVDQAILEGALPAGSKAGWYYQDFTWTFDGGIHPIVDFEVPYGEGFYINGADFGGTTIDFDGTVNDKDQPLTIDNGYVFVGNCMPAPTTLQSLSGEGFLDSTIAFLNPATGGQRAYKPNEDGAMIECEPEEVDAGAAVYGDFKYLDEDAIAIAIADDQLPDGSEPGWYYQDFTWTFDGGMHPVVDFNIAAGEGFYVLGADFGGCTLKIPTPLK